MNMIAKNIKQVLVKETASIKEAMRVIDRAGFRVAYVISGSGKFLGAVSDSEIRKAILRGFDVNSPAKDIINPNPIVLKEDELKKEDVKQKKIHALLKKMPDSEYIPVINRKGYPKFLFACTHLFSQKKHPQKKDAGNGKKVLVVGGAGYLGSVLARKMLSKGFMVRVLDVLLYGVQPIEPLLKNKPAFEFIEGDMRNITTLVRSLEGVDAVINLAAIVGDPACRNKPDAAIETNYLANKALAEACKYHQVNRFIYASTCSVYGAANGSEELSEESALNPVSLYARSKIQSEEGILSLEDENFSPTILRMSTLYGLSYRMRFDLVVNAMTKDAVTKKKIFVYNGGTQWRPFINVEDAADVFIRCLQSPLKMIKGQILNIGSKTQNYRIIDIAHMVKNCIPLARIVTQGRSHDARNYFVSFAKMEKILKMRAKRQLKESINKIKSSIINGEIKDVNDPSHYNIVEYA